jgi:hypothetical protein
MTFFDAGRSNPVAPESQWGRLSICLPEQRLATAEQDTILPH